MVDVGEDEDEMRRYPTSKKESVLHKILPPNNVPIPKIAKEEGISEGTLYKWKKQALEGGGDFAEESAETGGWSSAEKFMAVLETEVLHESELVDYCRKRDILPEQVALWRRACEEANEKKHSQESHLREMMFLLERKCQILKKELRRKEKALAETAALLVLKKNWKSLCDEEDS